MTTQAITRILILVSMLASSSGCGLLLGNIKPSARKSDDYKALDLAKGGADWKRLDPAKESASTDSSTTDEPTDVSDLSFQSQKTASIVSLTSTCRRNAPAEPHDLLTDTKQLLLGFTQITHKETKDLEVAGRPALQTTVEGQINGRPMRIRAVVLEADNCIFDLMLISRPDRFEKAEPDFTRFVSSFRLN